MRPTITLEQLTNLLKGTDFNNFTIEPFNKGFSTTVFKLSRYGETFFIKFFYKEEPVEAIVIAHKKMRDQGARLPEIVYFSNYDNPNSDDLFTIERAIPGQSLDSLKLDKRGLEKVLHDAGKELAKINGIPVKGVGWLKKVEGEKLVADGMNYEDFVLDDLEEDIEILVTNKAIDTKLASNIRTFIESNKHLLDLSDRSFLAHGDFCSDHIYANDGEFTGIIDFGDIRGTTKYHDLGHFYTYDRDKYEELLLGYKEVCELDADRELRVMTEAIVFGVRKLSWKVEKKPERVKGHKIFELFMQIE